MARVGSLRLEGGEELERKLSRLGVAVQKKLRTQAVRKSAKPMIKAARANAPRETGLLRKSLGVKIKTYKRSDTTAAILGARTGFAGKSGPGIKGNTKKRDPSKYDILVEGGTVPHFQPKAVIAGVVLTSLDHPGARPKRFLEPAFDAHKGGVVRLMADVLRKGINKEARKK